MLHAVDDRFGVSYNNNGVAARFNSLPQPPPHPPHMLHHVQQQHQQQQNTMNYPPAFLPPGAPPIHRGSLPPPPPPFSNQQPPLGRSPSVPAGLAWQGAPRPPPDVDAVSARMANASLNDYAVSRVQSVYGVIEHAPPRAPISQPQPPQVLSASPTPGRLAAALPSVESLRNALQSVQSPTASDTSRVAWIRDVLFLVNRATASSADASSSGDASPLSLLPSVKKGPVNIEDPALRDLADYALTLLINIMPTLPARDEKLSPPLAEALYIRAKLTASGLFPEYLPASPRNAFREFEVAARAGHA